MFQENVHGEGGHRRHDTRRRHDLLWLDSGSILVLWGEVKWFVSRCWEWSINCIYKVIDCPLFLFLSRNTLPFIYWPFVLVSLFLLFTPSRSLLRAIEWQQATKAIVIYSIHCPYHCLFVSILIHSFIRTISFGPYIKRIAPPKWTLAFIGTSTTLRNRLEICP